MTESFVVDRTGRGLLRLSGPQAAWFLENTVTATMESIEEGRWAESCFLTPKGKLVSHFRVGVLSDVIWLDVDPPPGDLADWLVRYRFRTKVEIEDKSASVWTVVGPKARELASDGEVREQDGMLIFGGSLDEVAVADLHGGGERVQEMGLREGSIEDYEVVRVSAGVAAFGVDYTTDNLPQEAGLTPVLPIDKGCYVGQETIARIHFRGHINKVVRTLRFEASAPDGLVGRALHLDGTRVGQVTSAVKGSDGAVVGIGMVGVKPPAGAKLDVEDVATATLGPIPEGTKAS